MEPITIDNVEEHLSSIRLCEIKSTKAAIQDDALNKFFFGATETEFALARALGSHYLFLFVVLNSNNTYGRPFFVPLTLAQVENRTRARRVQYQVNFRTDMTIDDESDGDWVSFSGRGGIEVWRRGNNVPVSERAPEIDADTSDLRDLERATTESRDAAARHARELTARREARTALEVRVAAVTRELTESERLAGELARERAVLVERGESLSAEHERLRGAIDERGSRIETLEADAAQADAAAHADAERIAALDARIAELSRDLELATRHATSTEADAERLQRARGEASTRLQVLRRMHESGAGLRGGVREALAAGRDGRLDGILGTVAELLVVPESLEVAIEVALGSRLQDIVVTAWSNAEAAIAHLKQSGAGRATFQPLDTVRADRAKTHAAGAIGLPGVLGVAAQLVSAPAHLAPVVAALLGRTLVTDELDTARAALGHLPAGWSVVTITGEIARAGGSVTGGSAAAESGTLARERELRELPTRSRCSRAIWPRRVIERNKLMQR